jgi:hypothetical protein
MLAIVPSPCSNLRQMIKRLINVLQKAAAMRDRTLRLLLFC